jgi:hypothetical protein
METKGRRPSSKLALPATHEQITVADLGDFLEITVPARIASAMIAHNRRLYPTHPNHETTDKPETPPPSSRTDRACLCILPLPGEDLAEHIAKLNRLFRVTDGFTEPPSDEDHDTTKQ